MTEMHKRQDRQVAEMAGEYGFSRVMQSLAEAAEDAAAEMRQMRDPAERKLAARLKVCADYLGELADYADDYDTGEEL